MIIAFREIRAMLHEKSFLLMVLLQLLLVSSSGLLSVGYVILTSPEGSGALSQLSNLIYVGVVTDTKADYVKAFEAGKVHHTFYESFQVADKDFKEGLIDAILVGDIGEDEKPSVVTLYLPSNSPKVPLTKLALKKVLLKLEEGVRARKVEIYSPKAELMPYRMMRYNTQGRYIEIYFIFTLPLLLFLPCVVSGSLVIDSITQDLESKRILNLAAAPITPNQIVFGKAFGSLILSITQATAWLLLMSFTFINPENHLILIILCGLYTTVFMNVGSLLAVYLKKMRSSQVLYTFASMSGISLFTPFANVHPLLLEFSPAYLLARLALGASPAAFAWQFTALFALAAASTLAVMASAKKVTEP